MTPRALKFCLAALVTIPFVSCTQVDAPEPLEPLSLSILEQPVKVLRDERNVAYIYANSTLDAFRAQGFITARDRLFQLTMLHRTFNGRLAETIGVYGLKQDRITHLIDLPAIAKRQAALVSDETRASMQAFIDGINAYIDTMPDDHPPALKAMGITPDHWRIQDQTAMLLLLNWGSIANWQSELLTLQLVDKLGPERAAEIHQLSINPDDETGTKALATNTYEAGELGLQLTDQWTTQHFAAQQLGSNNWAISGSRTASGKPILANDPHLPVTTLPGTWYPVGIITPEFRAVGASSGWSPGVFAGRTEHIAMGVTNAYGDMTDLTVEQIDPANPENYLEDEQSIPLEVRTVSIKIKDPAAETGFQEETLIIRSTRRGPLISDHGMAIAGDKAISLRWSAGEFLTLGIGIDALLFARNVDEARQAIQDIDASITMALVDVDGNIGHQSSGVVPLRVDGSTPYGPLGDNEWQGRIPGAEMPGVTNPARGWVGSANHRMISPDYPHYYSSYSAGTWRYRQLLDLLDGDTSTTPEQQWQNQRDATNTMAQRMLTFMLPALPADHEVAEILGQWDHVDSLESSAPAVFQALMRHAAMQTFKDELGEDLATQMLSSNYYWQDRFETLLAIDSPWFDDTETAEIENRDSIVHRSADLALAELRRDLGPNPEDWRWGNVHKISFKGPVPNAPLPEAGFNPGPYAMGGSNQTLYRAGSTMSRPYDVVYGASMRMVVDMADPDKIMAVQPGGVSGRLASPYLSDQVESWLNGDVEYWWFSDTAIKEHAVSTRMLLTTTPSAATD
jgi:penicillin G amidase